MVNPFDAFQSEKTNESKSIKAQLEGCREKLNKLPPADEIVSYKRPSKNGVPNHALMKKELRAFYGSKNYSVDRQGFGKVFLTKMR